MQTDKITICSVDYNSKYFLDMNWRLTSELNSADDFIWLVVDNNPESSAEGVEKNDRRFKVIIGPQYTEAAKDPTKESFYHGAGLNKALPYIKTRFVLLLDEDFFIVMPHWISRVLSHMQFNDIAFFGAPWNPKWFGHWRYFPCAHCLFIDLDKVDIKNLDFTPSFEKNKYSLEKNKYKILEKLHNLTAAFLKTFLSFSPLKINDRYAVGSYRDTGYKVFQRFGKKPLFKTECLMPVFNPRKEFKSPLNVMSRIINIEFFGTRTNHFIEKLLPDRFCVIPKRKNYYSETGFCDVSYFDAESRGWEEFLWQGKPFGFHVRRMPKITYQDMDAYSQLSDIRDAIESFLSNSLDRH